MAFRPEGKPTSQSIRDLVNDALEDKRKEAIQLGILDQIFGGISHQLEEYIDSQIRAIFNYAAGLAPEEKNETIIHALTRGNISLTFLLGISINTEYTQYSPIDVRELPNYIKLHDIAREKDVALRLVGVVQGDARSAQPALVVDIGKSYEEGAMDPSAHYPDLPPKKQDFDCKPNEFDL